MSGLFESPVPVTKESLEKCSRIFAQTFFDDPFISYVFPDVKERKLKSPGYWYFALRYAHLYGEVLSISTDPKGVVAWLPSNMLKLSLGRILRSGNYKLPWIIGYAAFKRLTHCVNRVMSIQEKKAPFKHMYLNALCVDPEYRGKGHANTLLMPMFKRLDEQKLPCYMETQKSHIVPFYEKFGFHLVDDNEIPGTRLKNWAMLRKPVS